MFEHSSLGRHRFTLEALENVGRLAVIFAAIILLAWMEWRFALR